MVNIVHTFEDLWTQYLSTCKAARNAGPHPPDTWSEMLSVQRRAVGLSAFVR